MAVELHMADSFFATTLVAKDCWVGFTSEPTLDSIEEARRLLDSLTDVLIRKKLNA
jgi:hypothetical protein